MATRTFIGLAIVLCVCVACVNAAAAVPAAEPKPPEEVATLAKKWLEVKQLGDAKVIGEYLSETFVGVGPLGVAEDKRAFVQRLANPKLEVKAIESSEQSLRSHGQVVVVTGIYQVKGMSGGKEIDGTYRYVDVVQKTGARWMVIASTLTKVVDPPAPAAK
jgi:hypothetical protein